MAEMLCALCGGGLGVSYVTIEAVAETSRPPSAESLQYREWHVHRECLLNPPALAKKS